MRTATALCIIITFVFVSATTPVKAAIKTFQFAAVMGEFPDGFLDDFFTGDELIATYTFDTATPGVPGADPTIVTQYHLAISSWQMLFPGRGYAFVGDAGSIDVGNDTDFGDRYIVSLSSPVSVGAPLPSGRMGLFFQIDLQDLVETGADLLSDGSIQTSPPDLSLADWSHAGRLDFGNDGQPYFNLTDLRAVPEPGTLGLVLVGSAILAARRRLRGRGRG